MHREDREKEFTSRQQWLLLKTLAHKQAFSWLKTGFSWQSATFMKIYKIRKFHLACQEYLTGYKYIFLRPKLIFHLKKAFTADSFQIACFIINVLIIFVIIKRFFKKHQSFAWCITPSGHSWQGSYFLVSLPSFQTKSYFFSQKWTYDFAF